MAEQCCVCDEHGENQCPKEAVWYAWDLAGERYYDTDNYYCDEHVNTALVPGGRTEVWDIKLAGV